jgi:chemotaxis protein MotB
MSGHKRRHEEHEEEEHENHERWLVSYADMMTLLMVLFIVLFAISQVDQKKFSALKTGLAAGFGAPVEILPGADSLLDPGGSVAPDSVNLAGAAGNQRTNPNAASAASNATVNPSTVAKLATATEQAQVKGEVSNLKKAQKALQAALNKAGLRNGATFRFDQRGLVVTIATDNVLFHSGSATLEPEGTKILNTLAPTLRALPNELSIDGHTNNIPISTAQFPSNWELAADRATGVLRYLHSRDKIPYNRMSATSYADTEPRVPAGNPSAVKVNRRVEIIVLARVDDAAGRAIATLGNSTSSTSTTP